MARITIRGLSKRFAAAGGASAPLALDNLNLDVADGELLVMVGPSGCGKSTALRLIAGLEQPTAGTITIGDRDMTEVAPQHRDVAMVFQGYALYPHLSVRDNMAFPLKMRGLDKRAQQKKVEAIAAMVGLEKKLQRLPSELSGGERQRVAMGRAIVREPSVFLFDEPLSNLDAKLRAELRVELVSLIKRLGSTAVYVTHDQAEAMTMSDRVAVLNHGRLQQLAAPRRIYQQPTNAFVATFVGSPAMNMLACDGQGPVVGHFEGPLRPPAQARQFGFRPEHLVAPAAAARAAWSQRHPAGYFQLQGTVLTNQRLGAESLVYLQVDHQRVTMRVQGFADDEANDVVRMCVSKEHLHWFDDAGVRLGDDNHGQAV